jgi:hypothetical protein
LRLTGRLLIESWRRGRRSVGCCRGELLLDEMHAPVIARRLHARGFDVVAVTEGDGHRMRQARQKGGRPVKTS